MVLPSYKISTCGCAFTPAAGSCGSEISSMRIRSFPVSGSTTCAVSSALFCAACCALSSVDSSAVRVSGLPVSTSVATGPKPVGTNPGRVVKINLSNSRLLLSVVMRRSWGSVLAMGTERVFPFAFREIHCHCWSETTICCAFPAGVTDTVSVAAVASLSTLALIHR